MSCLAPHSRGAISAGSCATEGLTRRGKAARSSWALSGTVADAVSALKPLIAFKNRTLDAIVAKYGPIGWLVESEAELFYLVATLDRQALAAARPEWMANLRKIREGRRPEALAAGYAALVEDYAL